MMLNPAEQANVLPNGMIQASPSYGMDNSPSPIAPQSQGVGIGSGQTSMPSGVGGAMGGASASQTPEQMAAEIEKIRVQVGAQLSRMLVFRRPYDPIRLKFFKQYIQVRDQKLFPDGVTPRSNLFVPYAESNVETVVSRTDDAFFSVRPFFECVARASNNPQAADNMQVVMEYKLHRAKLVQAVEDFTRNCAIYGHAAIKVDWDFGFEVITYAEQVPVMVPMLDEYNEPVIGMDGKPAQKQMNDPNQTMPDGTPNPQFNKPMFVYRLNTKKVSRKCPKFWAIDPYDLLLDPDGGMIAHLVEKNFGEMLKEQANYRDTMGKDYYFQAALDKISGALQGQYPDPNSVIVRYAEFWNEIDNTVTQITFLEDRDALSYKDQRYALRTGNSYTPYKRPYYAGEQVVLWTGANPFMHQRCTILHTSYVKLANEPYGRGVVEIGSDINEALNTTVNAIRDNWNVGINSRYAFNTDMDLDYDALTQLNVPGGLVGVSGDVNVALKPIETFKPNSSDYMIIPLLKEELEQATGISDFYSKGVGGGGANNTATGISTIVNESNFRFRMFIRNIETDIMEPLLEMCASNIQQFMTDAEEIMIMNAQPAIPKMPSGVAGSDPVMVTVTPEDIIGTYSFDLVAAQYATNEVVRQRNLMALAAQFEQNPYIDKFNGTKLLLKTFKIPEWSSLLKTQQQVDQEQQGAQQQAQQQQLQQMQLQLHYQEAEQELQMRMMLFEHQLAMEKAKAGIYVKTESDLIKQANSHNLKTKEGQVPLKPTKPMPNKEGRPRSPFMPEGKLPGTGNTGPTREQGQGMGLNAMGLEGLGEAGGQ